MQLRPSRTAIGTVRLEAPIDAAALVAASPLAGRRERRAIFLTDGDWRWRWLAAGSDDDHPALLYYWGRRRVERLLRASGGDVDALFAAARGSDPPR